MLGFFLFLICSCNDETDRLKKEIDDLQSIISLQNAYASNRKIVSVSSATTDNTDYWNITFEDNTTLQIAKSVVLSIELDETTQEYFVKLFDNQQLIFNQQEIIYPTGLVALTQDIKLLKGMELPVEFRVNPSNAIFNFDVTSADCQIKLDLVDKETIRSYVTDAEKCRITRIEPSKDANGNAKEGQYTAYIADNGAFSSYFYTLALVLSTKDRNDNQIQLSTSAIDLERKRDTGLPIVVINTENKAEILDKENWIKAAMSIDGIDKFPDYEGITEIRGRGNSTWAYPKKPFALKLDSKSEILGMPAHKRWVLLANYMDRTMIRNHISYEISRRTGMDWTVRGQFVELVLNDEHLGNYYLCEQIKPDENRVNITEMDADDLDSISITGGYILEYDSYFDEVNKFRTKIFDLPVMFQEPDEEVLQPAQFEYMQNYINHFEELLTAQNFVKTRAYASLIADTTFMDWWIVMELTSNFEAMHPKSCYFYKDRMDVLKAGPMWDFDYGTYTSSNVSGYLAKDKLYYAQLFQDPVFVAGVKERWRRFKPHLEEITELILEVGYPLEMSAKLNEEMWSLLNHENINEDNLLSFRDALYRMRSNYANRLRWLDNAILQLK
ncbi:MAG: CotH kinase family protein [Tannerella sp.]|nr:CotH kinase family protein [Tannerella sp.]